MMARQTKICGILAACLLVWVTAVAADPDAIAQVPTETPGLLNLSPIDQGSVGQAPGEPTPTRTPTPEGNAFLEAKEFANVRAEPSTESAQLGQINNGETYTVIGRYASWIQFQFQASPTGKGWVYDELVDLSGNTASIPEIDPYAADQQLDSASVGATATQSILTQTPGGVLTATAVSQQGGQASVITSTPEGTRGILPTFTYPPGLVAIAPTSSAPTGEQATDSADPNVAITPPTSSDSLPPIAPILILGGVGVLGLVVNGLRRH